MENTNTGNANDANNPNQEWLNDEKKYSADNQREEDDKEKEENKEEENKEGNADWGSVDPLDTPGGLPDPMDPSGPGSAV